MAAVLGLSTAAYGDTVTIKPLDESSVSQIQSGVTNGSSIGTGSITEGSTGTSAASGDPGSSNAGGPGINNTGNAVSPAEPNTAESNTAEPNTAGSNTAEPNAADLNTAGSNTAGQLSQPEIQSEGAALIDASTGSVLFAKNGDSRFYPASITKLMTALLVAENCSLDDTVTFSASATTGLESGAVSINMTEGDTLTVRQCLYALLLKSANEVGNALAEHVAGSNAKFAEMMNARAAALGCTGTHFTNPHGLNDTDHYTTPQDMALIARAAFANDVVKTVASTRTYSLPATKKNPSGLTVTMGHKMLNPGDSRYYPGIIGGKTGYTSKAGNTLVTAAEKDGVRLIAVVMKSKSTHYTDTKALLDYGFQAVQAGSSAGTDGSTTGPGGSASGSTAGSGGSASDSGGPGAVAETGRIQ